MATTAGYSADVLIPSGGVDASQHQWEYAVPIRQDSAPRRSKSRSSHDSLHRKSRDRNSKGSRSSSMSRQLHDSNYLNSSRNRRDHSLGRRGSEAGSSRSLYGHDSASRSVGNVRESVDGFMTHSEEEAKWIHRDKLAKIESEELHQAARLFHRRTGDSKSSRGRSHISGASSLASPHAEYSDAWPELQEEDHDDDAEFRPGADPGPGPGPYNHGEQKTWDLRKPEEIAADEEAGNGFYSNPALRKSSSRIPIPTASPAPILYDQSGREITRSRANTLADDDAAAPYSKSRRGSEAVSDDNDIPFTPGGAFSTTTPSGSRPNSRSAQATMQGANGKKPASTKGPTNTARKTSGATATGAKKTPTTKSRATSGAGNTQRPTTRGADSRPTTAVNRPEGDPPWLATMYKPDPRLPPDQQIIPTHARRVQQEQWEKEGKTPTTYDREFAPLAITSDEEKARRENSNNTNQNENHDSISDAPPPVPSLNLPPPPPAAKLSTEGSNGMWPLATPDGPETKRLSGVYSPMPKVQDPSSQTGAGMTPKWSPPIVTAEAEAPKEKKAGCGCCVVM